MSNLYNQRLAQLKRELSDEIKKRNLLLINKL